MAKQRYIKRPTPLIMDESCSSDQMTLLDAACQGHIQRIRKLIAGGTNVNGKSKIPHKGEIIRLLKQAGQYG